VRKDVLIQSKSGAVDYAQCMPRRGELQAGTHKKSVEVYLWLKPVEAVSDRGKKRRKMQKDKKKDFL